MTNPYRKDVRHLDWIDLYVLADLYDVDSHPVFHAIKKLLCAGKRGAKDYEQDLMEAIESIERELQMMPVAETREVGGVQECGFKPMHHEGIMPGEDLEPDWDRRHPSLRFAVKDEQGKFVFCKDQPSSGTFWIRPADFDEQRIDAIGQNGNDGEHYHLEYNGPIWWMTCPNCKGLSKIGLNVFMPCDCCGKKFKVSMEDISKASRETEAKRYEPALTLTELIKAVGPMPMARDWTYEVDWMKASPHHQFAYRNERGDIVFSMHQPMGYDFIGRPTAQ